MDERVNLLTGGFRHFFDKKDFIKHGDKPGEYKNAGTGLVYIHDFPKDGNFDDNFPEVAEKHERRAKRLLDKIHNSDKILAVYIDAYGDPSADKVKDAMKKLDDRFGRKIDLLYIYGASEPILRKRCRVVFSDGHLIIAEFFGQKDVFSDDGKVGVVDLLSFVKLDNLP